MPRLSTATFVIFTVIFLVTNFVCVLGAALPVQSDGDPNGGNLQLEDEPQGRLEITYNSSEFQEIDHDILQVIGDPSKISLSCHSLRNNVSRVRWLYHGSDLFSVEHVQFKRSADLGPNAMSIDLSKGPPVARLECILRENSTITNNTLIYTGGDRSPYLYNNQRTLKATVINETIAVLPCLLNYPVDNTEDKALQLLKNGEIVENKNNCLHYVPEQGFFLNLTKVEQEPLGIYQCKVLNSTQDDYVFVELNEGSFIHTKYRGFWSFFYEKAPVKQNFECSAPNSMFNGEFRWYYQLNNGTSEEFKPEKIVGDEKKNVLQRYPSTEFVDSVYVTFYSTEITHVVCACQTKGSGKFFNSSVQVEVMASHPPEILNDPDSEPVIYKPGKNITCAANGQPVDFRWFKDGRPVRGLNISDYQSTNWVTSTLVLNPHADDKESNYTCEASNFLGNATHHFRVQVHPEDSKEWSWLLVTVLAVTLAVITILLGAVLTMYKIRFTPRRFGEDKIRKFFEGYTSTEVDNEYDTIPFDTSKNYDKDALVFDETKELSRGNFGTVYFGFLTRNGSKTPVAIKAIKDNKDASQEEMDFAFQNFLKEIKLMQSLGNHPNVVGYIGAMTADIEKYCAYLMVEYCNKGDLSSYLEKHREHFHDDMGGLHQNSNNSEFSLKTSHLIKWAENIAAGMEFVSSKRILHMDLATRNILLHYDGYMREGFEPPPELLTAKICDFGLSKDLAVQSSNSNYYQLLLSNEGAQSKRVLPMRWLSPEALENLRFTTESDIWALGVLYWEMFTLGDLPYRDLPLDDRNCRNHLIWYFQSGNRLRPADFAPREMFEIISKCWNETPSERPRFSEIRSSLLAIIENRTNEMQSQQNIVPGNVNYTMLGLLPSTSSIDGLSENSDDDSNEEDDDGTIEDDEADHDHDQS